MKKYILIVLVFSSVIYAKVNTVVSILPQKTFVEAIGGDKVNVALMVKPGNSPHTYEPKPSQMRDISKADIYFSIGVEFENIWLPKFTNQNKKMKVIDLSSGVNKLAMVEHHDEEGGDEEKHDEHEHHHGALDPHIWTSTDNVKIIAKNIFEALVKVDPKNEEYYDKNYDKFIDTIEETNYQITTIFKDLPRNAKFMVFHPSWGYFAKQYLLIQMPIEVEGKSPKPKAIAKIIEHAKEEGVKAIFTNPEVSDNVAKQIANELNIPVINVSPLKSNWSQNLINLAKAIANKQ